MTGTVAAQPASPQKSPAIAPPLAPNPFRPVPGGPPTVLDTPAPGESTGVPEAEAPHVSSSVPTPEAHDPETSVPAAMVDPWKARPFSVEAHVGLGAPLGLLGLGLDASPVPFFSAMIGVGTNGSSLQYAAQGRLRFPGGNWGFGIGAGASMGGPYTWHEGGLLSIALDGPAVKKWDRVYWLNVDLFAEHRTASGFLVRGYFGSAQLMNISDGVCTNRDSHDLERCQRAYGNEPLNLLYTGLALGQAW
jgi:hypothetical protein